MLPFFGWIVPHSLQVRGSQSPLLLQCVDRVVDPVLLEVVDRVVDPVIFRVVLEVATRLGSASHVGCTQTSSSKLPATAVSAMMS